MGEESLPTEDTYLMYENQLITFHFDCETIPGHIQTFNGLQIQKRIEHRFCVEYAKEMVIMEVCIFFFYAMILLPGIAASVHQVKSFLNHTAYLSCFFANSQKTDIEDLRVFWQKGTDEVVHEVYHGQEKHDNLSPKYINRTKMDMGKWTLQLLNAGIVDEGQYTCIIQHRVKGSPQVIHKSECFLHIIEIQGEEMEQVKINFFGPLIAVIILITLLVGFVILKKNRNSLSTNQTLTPKVIELYKPFLSITIYKKGGAEGRMR
ncbi:t-lymphocyte activation antigen cd86 [Limosa lapponica baueri]|uniref:T-lymphocyte activation antigen cd86 n=1 Tax=Limosa lapponica baueri TaxID=1758121 RepID=A0A2I0TNY9_LIMLA|nr:t-lymphocyte activation antigen cd86 [Limosa lapponica baueri]